MRVTSRGSVGFLRLKRTSAASIGIVMIWMCLGGGYILLRTGDVLGWVALGFALVLVISPFTGSVQRYWHTDVSAPAFPMMILVANTTLAALNGGIAWTYWRDPFLTYNDLNTLAAVVFGVAAILSFLALAANVIALEMDRRQR